MAHTDRSNGTTYNGWANYETWAVGMFLDGNYTGEATYHAALETVQTVVQDHVEAAEDGEQPSCRGHVADALKQFVTDSLAVETDDLPNGLAADLLAAAVNSVDWHELAAHKVKEVTHA